MRREVRELLLDMFVYEKSGALTVHSMNNMALNVQMPNLMAYFKMT